MTPNEIHEEMCDVFRKVPLRNFRILKAHEENRTPVICGKHAENWIMPGGFG